MPRKHRDLGVVLVTKSVKRGSKWQIGCELTPEELQAIGLITVHWAHLEHCLLVRTSLLAKSANVAVPRDAASLSFTKRLRAFRDLAQTGARDAAERKALNGLADRIAGAEGKRHKITHGLWDWNELGKSKLTTYSFRPPFNYEHTFDVDQLEKLAVRLSEILFELSFPSGVSDLAPGPYAGRFVKPPWAQKAGS